MSQTILITGATSGIGLALAQQFAGQGARLLLIGRRPLAELAAPIFKPETYCQADLTQPECARQVADFLARQQIKRLDLLVHNAGVGYYGDLTAQSPSSIDDLLAVNVLAPMRLTHRLRPLLLAAQGKVVFISSVATAVPTPEYAVYGAAKAALEGFARSLRVEWQGKIDVQIIRPGATRTPMHEKLGISPETLDWRKFPPADQTAGRIAAAINRSGRDTTIGLGNQLLSFGGRNGRLLLDPLLQKRARQAAKGLVAERPSSSQSRQPVCVITGAADGIGKALAGQFARAGYAIVGIDVDEARAAAAARELQQAGLTAHFLPADLGNNASLTRLVEALRPFAPLDIFIHNAGISAAGRFEQLDLTVQEQVVAVNFRAPLQLTMALGRAGLFHTASVLVFLASLSHYVSYPGAAVYAASKDGLTHYARSLQAAWPTAHTLTVFPGPTRTAHARRYSPDNSREAARMPPEQVAAAIQRAVQTGRRRLIPGPANQLLALGGHLAPRLLEWSMKKAILEKLDV